MPLRPHDCLSGGIRHRSQKTRFQSLEAVCSGQKLRPERPPVSLSLQSEESCQRLSFSTRKVDLREIRPRFLASPLRDESRQYQTARPLFESSILTGLFESGM